MNVIAAKGLLVPKEDKPREYINDSDVVDVPESTYYLRLLADSDLQRAAAANVTSDKTTAKGAD